MDTKVFLSLALFVTLNQYPADDFVGRYFKCSLECIETETIFIKSDFLVYSLVSYHSDRQYGYSPSPKQVGKWEIKNDSLLFLKMIKDKKGIESFYILKIHNSIGFLIPPSEESQWPLTIHKMDSVFQKSDELYFFNNRRNWKDDKEKERFLKKLKRDVYSRFFYWQSPVKNIYIKDE